MYGCESWTVKKAECWGIDAFELWCWRTLDHPLDYKEIQLVHPKRDQSWVFIRRTDAEAETPILWPPHGKSWLIGKDSDAGKDWGQEETGMTEDEMAGWHHWLDGHEFELTLVVGDGQGGLVCCDSWGCKELVMTEQLNWTELTDIPHWVTESSLKKNLLPTSLSLNQINLVLLKIYLWPIPCIHWSFYTMHSLTYCWQSLLSPLK